MPVLISAIRRILEKRGPASVTSVETRRRNVGAAPSKVVSDGEVERGAHPRRCREHRRAPGVVAVRVTEADSTEPVEALGVPVVPLPRRHGFDRPHFIIRLVVRAQKKAVDMSTALHAAKKKKHQYS